MTLRPARTYFAPYANVRVATPSREVVTLDELKHHLRKTDNEEDEYLNRLIKTAREYFEDHTGLALITQTHQMTMDGWAGGREPWWDGVREGSASDLFGGYPRSVELPRFPLSAVDTINVYDEAGNSTAVTISNVFDVDTNSRPGRITLKGGAAWPVATQANNAVEINYTAGYGSSVSAVPTPLAQAVLNMAGYMYDHRGGGCTPAEAYDKSGAERYSRPYRPRRL